MKVIFLDIDGVLNGHESLCPDALCGRLHADKVERLNRILRETDARIVLSSAWRYLILRGEMNLVGMGWLLRSHGVIANRLIGHTRADFLRADPTYDGKAWPVHDERGEQVREWLSINGHRVTNYVVVDDLDLGISAAGHPFVQTIGQIGLTEADTTRIIGALTP